MYVNHPLAWVKPKASGGARQLGRGGRRRADPLQPAGRIVELGLGRQRLGRAPDALERLDAALARNRVAERLALLVLAQLEVQPEQALDQPLGRRAAVAASVHRLAQALVARDRLGGDRV